MWNDPAIGIDWKSFAPDVKPLLSEKDGKHSAFDTEFFCFTAIKKKLSF